MSDLSPVLAAIASLEESSSQWARRAQVLEDAVPEPVTTRADLMASLVADVYREAAHAVRYAVEEVRLSE